MVLKIRMRDEDIRTINYLRCRSEQAIKEVGENADREESEMARAVELLNRIFYGCINQKLMGSEQGNPDDGLPYRSKPICQKNFHELREVLRL